MAVIRALSLPHGDPASLVIYFTKGLADVVEAEVEELAPAAAVTVRNERFLVLSAAVADADRIVTTARTVEDVRLLVSGPTKIADAGDFAAVCAEAARNTNSALHAPAQQWSVTLSARKPLWREKPVWDPGPVIGEQLHGAHLTATSRCPVDLRIQIDLNVVHIAVNLRENPLTKGSGAAAVNRLGALRPTVAAALVRMAVAHVEPAVARRGLYDPFCGTGTIVAEATRAGLPVYASDVDAEAVEITRRRLASVVATGKAVQDARPRLASMPTVDEDALLHRAFVKDIRSGLDPRVTARMLVGNMPWGKQVMVEGRLALFEATCSVVARTVHNEGCAILLTTHEEQLLPRLRRHGLRADARRIGLLGQTPAIVLARPA